jgi:hypothetical protein
MSLLNKIGYKGSFKSDESGSAGAPATFSLGAFMYCSYSIFANLDIFYSKVSLYAGVFFAAWAVLSSGKIKSLNAFIEKPIEIRSYEGVYACPLHKKSKRYIDPQDRNNLLDD